MTIGEIINHPENQFMQDVIRNEKTKQGDCLKCIRCEKKYRRGEWDFYSLCNKCFKLFDQQKMLCRFGKTEVGYESSKEWIKNNPYGN